MAQTNRYLSPYLLKDLKKKMVLLGGPRQCGKTTISKMLLNQSYMNKGQYLLWDDDDDKKVILSKMWSDDRTLLIFDELHKYPKWKNWLKGVYDKQNELHDIFVTGSARLDIYKRGGDSLLGRYHYWRMHPFTLDEHPQSMTSKLALKRLMTVGGFPEPFLDGNVTEAKRWRKERFQRILREDVREISAIKEIGLLDIFSKMLQDRVSQQVVLSNIATDLQISPVTAKDWLELMEKMYICFSVRTWTKNLPRAIQKTPKVYFYDNADVHGDEGAVFENLVATHLLKRIQFLEDSTGDEYRLAYIRDKDEREVDFLIVKNNQPLELIEAKLGDKSPSSSLLYYAEKLKVPKASQIIYKPIDKFVRGNLQIISAEEYFSSNILW